MTFVISKINNRQSYFLLAEVNYDYEHQRYQHDKVSTQLRDMVTVSQAFCQQVLLYIRP